MGGIVLVILVVAVVMAGTIAIALFVLRRVGDRAQARADELRADVERRGETWQIPLAGAVYQGGGSPARRNKGHGVLGLTDRRVVFLPIAGELVSIPRVRLKAAQVEDRRREAAAGHRHRLVLRLDDDAVAAFLVDEPARWEQALAASGSSGGAGT